LASDREKRSNRLNSLFQDHLNVSDFQSSFCVIQNEEFPVKRFYEQHSFLCKEN